MPTGTATPQSTAINPLRRTDRMRKIGMPNRRTRSSLSPLFSKVGIDADGRSVYTTSNGVPVPHPYITQRAGLDGPLLLQDFHLIDLLSHFDRER